jgi:hypothetical protein
MNTELDRAILAYRANPTEANRLRVLAAQEAHMLAFFRRQTEEFQVRTR